MKKCDDFIRAISLVSNETELKEKYKEHLVKNNVMSEHDPIAHEFLNLKANM